MKIQTFGLDPKPSPLKYEKKKRIPPLNVILTLFGLLYLVFIVDTFISGVTYDPYNPENVVVNLAFVLFLVGYYLSWRKEGVAGIIFILWWAVMWILALFIVDHDRGGGVVMGLPLFILGILFIISWHREKRGKPSVPVAKPES